MIMHRSDRARSLPTVLRRAFVLALLVAAAPDDAPARSVASLAPSPSSLHGGGPRERDAERVPRFGRALLPDGVRLHFAEQGPEDGVPVVLIHGYTDSWFSWSLVLPLLSDDLHVYALDQRGQGASDRPATGYRVDELARDVIAFMDVQGIERAVVVGHSGGGLVAQQVAAAAPERVGGLVLVGTGTTARHVVGLEDLRAAVHALEDPVDPAFARGFQEGTVHAPVPPDFMERVIADSGRLPAWTWQALLEGMLATGPATGLARARLPTLVLWGDRDAIFTLEEQEALLVLAGGTFEIYRDTGHAPHWERPHAFARDLNDFVAGLERAVPRAGHAAAKPPRAAIMSDATASASRPAAGTSSSSACTAASTSSA